MKKRVRHKRSSHSSNWAVCAQKTKGNYTDSWKRVTCPACLKYQPQGVKP
jgi:hypothetical protein